MRTAFLLSLHVSLHLPLMSSILLSLPFSLAIIHQQQQQGASGMPSSTSYPQRDTIIERTNPAALDMSREQLFIDTSRTSSYYQQLALWQKKPFLYDSWMLEQATSKKAQGCTSHTTGLKFPRTWLTLHWYNGKFLLYEPCDGIDTDARYHFTDSLLFVLRGVDSEALPICSYRRTKHKEVVAMLDGGTEVYITPTTTPNVYLMTSENFFTLPAFVCPIEKYKHFELLVHHCPERKVAPPQIFDKMP